MADAKNGQGRSEVIEEAKGFLRIGYDYEANDDEYTDALEHACAIIAKLLRLLGHHDV